MLLHCTYCFRIEKQIKYDDDDDDDDDVQEMLKRKRAGEHNSRSVSTILTHTPFKEPVDFVVYLT